MADQVNPAGSSPSGLPLALSAVAAPRSGVEQPNSAKIATDKPPGQVVKAESTQTPEAAMGKLNNYLEHANSEIKFKVDKGTGRPVFQIINQNNGAVVMQVPSDEMLAMARNLQAMDKAKEPSGVLVNKEG